MRQLGPFFAIVALPILVVVSCELLPTKRIVRYVPSEPDTVVVRDTVEVDDDDEFPDKPRWGR